MSIERVCQRVVRGRCFPATPSDNGEFDAQVVEDQEDAADGDPVRAEYCEARAGEETDKRLDGCHGYKESDDVADEKCCNFILAKGPAIAVKINDRQYRGTEHSGYREEEREFRRSFFV